jgi:tetratricopeptide (TPR) repeat protein
MHSRPSQLIFILTLLAGLFWAGTRSVQAENLGWQASNLLRQNRLEEGVSLCRQVEGLSQYDQQTAFNCAWIYFRKDMAPAAEKIIEKFKKLASLPEYQLLVAFDYMVKKQYDRAKAILDTVQKEHAGKPAAITAEELNAELYELKDPKKGIDTAAFIYRQLINKANDRGRVSWGLGRYYLSKGDSRRAIQYLEETAVLWPTHVGSRYNLAMIYLAQVGEGSLNQAAKWLGEAYKLNKADPNILEQLGVLFEKKGLKAEAIKKWQKALELNKDLVLSKEKINEYFAEVLDNLIETKRFPEALKKIESAPKLVTEQPKYILRRAMVYRGLEKYEKALADFQTYLSSNPKDSVALREAGICYANLKLIDQAITFFNKSALEDPANGINFAWLAWGLESKGELMRARDAWRKAIDLLKDPRELEKATRKLANIESQLKKRETKQDE